MNCNSLGYSGCPPKPCEGCPEKNNLMEKHGFVIVDGYCDGSMPDDFQRCEFALWDEYLCRRDRAGECPLPFGKVYKKSAS